MDEEVQALGPNGTWDLVPLHNLDILVLLVGGYLLISIIQIVLLSDWRRALLHEALLSSMRLIMRRLSVVAKLNIVCKKGRTCTIHHISNIASYHHLTPPLREFACSFLFLHLPYRKSLQYSGSWAIMVKEMQVLWSMVLGIQFLNNLDILVLVVGGYLLLSISRWFYWTLEGMPCCMRLYSTI